MHEAGKKGLSLLVVVLAGLGAVSGGEPGKAEPNEIPNVVREGGLVERVVPRVQTATQRYDFGEISPDEQHYIELINRARRDPVEEAQWLIGLADEPQIGSALDFFNTDLARLLGDDVYGFQTFGVGQPLAPNLRLWRAAEIHNDDLFENTYQGHVNDKGETAQHRIEAEGYVWNTWGENVFSTSENNIYGHAGFQIDWGDGPFGIQNPPGHRVTIHNTNFREIGVAVLNDSKPSINPNDPSRQDVGPQIVTQVLAASPDQRPYITGVAYYDLNGNNFYEPGEGIQGLRVETAEGTWWTETAESGGYALPANGNGEYTMQFTTGGVSIPIEDSGVSVSGGLNSKFDLVLDYAGPAFNLPPRLSTVSAAEVGIAPMAGASDYQWQLSSVIEGPFSENAESGVNPFAAEVSDGYNTVTRINPGSGSRGFHLFHNTRPPSNQHLVWEREFILQEGAKLTFLSQHMAATQDQVARVYIQSSTESSWRVLWSNPGQGQIGDQSFQTVELPLNDFIGQEVRFRFSYEFSVGSFFVMEGFPDPPGIGWFFDDVVLTGAILMDVKASGETGGSTSFQVTSPESGEFGFRGRSFISGRWFPWGTVNMISATTDPIESGPVSIAVNGLSLLDPDTLDIVVSGGTLTEGDLLVRSSMSVDGPWTEVQGISMTEGESAGVYHLRVPINSGDDNGFFLVELR